MSELAGVGEVRPNIDEVSVELTAALREMGAVVLAAETLETVVKLVIAAAVATIPGTAGAGVTLVDARGKRSMAASDDLVAQADTLQYQLDAGPCLTAWRDQVNVRIDDLQTETRWPRWCAAAADLGVRSMLSVPLVSGETSIGAIKVYSDRLDSYNERDEGVLALFAQQAAILLVNSQTLADARKLSADLTLALANRDIIGQAKGILIAQGAEDEQAAFTMLSSASQRTHVKLHAVARQLIQSVIDHRTEHRNPQSPTAE